MNKIILSGDTVQIELIDGEENTSGTWTVERDEEDSSNNIFGGDTGVDADMEAGDLETAHIMAMEEMEDEYDELLPETLMFRKYG
jgi:hypothetical protein